jgi:uncharacterized protein YbjT (DUF2867 family)
LQVLLTGATGLIGSAVLARLAAEGHEVTAVARAPGARAGPASARWVPLDIAKATAAEDWLPHLAGIEAVIDCAGVLQDGPRDSTAGVHVKGAAALFAACAAAGVRRVIRVSAIGVDGADAATAFACTKLAGDRALMALDLDWVVLRPSVVVGRAAYGGSALLRALAALPAVPQMPEAGALQIVPLDDLVLTIVHFLRRDAPARLVLEVTGPERLSLADAVLAYRRWLGWGDAPRLRLPGWLAHAASGLADAAALVGWRSPMRTTARHELARGVTGDGSEWQRLTGIAPRSLADGLAREPASVQERWFAGLYLLKPVVLGVLSLFWMATGLLALGPGWSEAERLLADSGPAGMAPFGVAAGAAADIAIGIAIAVRRTARPALLAAVGVSLLYLLLGTALRPGVWLDPLGPLVKVLPVLVLHLVALAILDER